MNEENRVYGECQQRIAELEEEQKEILESHEWEQNRAADKEEIADLKCKLAEAEDEIEQHCRWIEDAYRREEQYKRQLADAHRALENVQKNCCCNRQKGFDYGEKHPTLGVHPSGRWLTPKEIAGIALREAGKCGLEK